MERTDRALRSGALEAIPSTCRVVEDGGIAFVVRLAPALAQKPQAATASSAARANPFLPYDEALFVTDLSDTHVCLLNKYSVLEHHLLVVTRRFEEQESLLTRADFEALCRVSTALDGLAFTNAGSVAGASQRHKHLQWVPAPIGPGPERTPLDAVLRRARGDGVVAGLPFRHALARLDPALAGDPRRAAEHGFEHYRGLLRTLELERSPAPYNLLATREWMLLVPRSREGYASISVNALGFAGALLVRSASELARLEQLGPLELLRRVGIASRRHPPAADARPGRSAVGTDRDA